MRANSWLYQYYSLHSKMHYGLAYEAHPSRLPTYYSPMMPYHPSPTEAAVPHSPYHLHPPVSLNGTPTQNQPPPPPPTVLQYGGVPYTSLPAEPEQARWPTPSVKRPAESEQARWPAKRPASPTSPSPSKSPARASSSSPGSTGLTAISTGGIIYPEASPYYVQSCSPAGGYGSTQVLAAVSYSHLVSLRNQKQQQMEADDTTSNSEMILNRPTSYHLPIASVLSESNRVLSDNCDNDYIKNDSSRVGSGGHMFSTPSNRLEIPYVRYGNTYPLVEFDPRRRFSSKWDKQGSLWGGGTENHLGPIQGDCFPYGDSAKSQFLESYQELGQARWYDFPRRDDLLRLSSETVHPFAGMESQQDIVYGNHHLGARPCLVRPPSNSPSPHSRASSEC